MVATGKSLVQVVAKLVHYSEAVLPFVVELKRNLINRFRCLWNVVKEEHVV